MENAQHIALNEFISIINGIFEQTVHLKCFENDQLKPQNEI